MTKMIWAASIAGYTSIIYLLRKRHNQVLDDTPHAKTATEAHAFTLRYIYSDFHFLAVKALEFGLFKTYAIPSISKILSSTGELVDECPRRYDDIPTYSFENFWSMVPIRIVPSWLSRE